MPNQPKTPLTTFRLDAEDKALLDALGQHFGRQEPREEPWNRSRVLRVAIRRLAQEELPPKKSRKKAPPV